MFIDEIVKSSLDCSRLYFATANLLLFEGSYTRVQENLSIVPFCDYVNSNARFSILSLFFST